MMRLGELFRLDEGGVINAKNDVIMPYRIKGGGEDRTTIPSATKDILAVGRLRRWPQPVTQWFSSVFLKWLARTEGLSRDLKVGIKDYYDDYLGDTLFGGVETEPDYSDALGNDDLYDALIATLPEYARDGDIILPYGLDLVLDNHDNIAQLVDYLIARVEQGESIERISVDQGLAQSRRWHARKIKATGQSVEGQDIKTVLDYGDGMKMVRVLTPEGLDRDSECLGHCVGQGGYDRRIKEGTVKIFSLRDKSDHAHATIEVTSGRVVQIKGSHNGPVEQEFRLHVKKFIIAAGFPVVADHNKIGLSKIDID